MWSRSPVCARPVRTLPRSAFSVSTDFPIFCSAVFLMSAIIVPPEQRFSVLRRASSVRARPLAYAGRWTLDPRPPSTMHQRALVAPQHHALQRAGDVDREYLEQHVLVAAQRKRGRVHHPEILDDRLVECELDIALRLRVLVRVRRVHAVDLGCLQHDVHTHFAPARRNASCNASAFINVASIPM